jgi:hypothetical protein
MHLPGDFAGESVAGEEEHEERGERKFHEGTRLKLK